MLHIYTISCLPALSSIAFLYSLALLIPSLVYYFAREQKLCLIHICFSIPLSCCPPAPTYNNFYTEKEIKASIIRHKTKWLNYRLIEVSNFFILLLKKKLVSFNWKILYPFPSQHRNLALKSLKIFLILVSGSICKVPVPVQNVSQIRPFSFHFVLANMSLVRIRKLWFRPVTLTPHCESLVNHISFLRTQCAKRYHKAMV